MAAKADVLIAEVDLGKVPAEDARTRAKELTLTKDQQKRFNAVLIEAEAAEIVATVQKKEDVATAAPKLLEMKKAGRIPTGEAAFGFWNVLMMSAEETKNARLYEEGLTALEKKYADNPQMKPRLAKLRDTLKKLKKG